jgi:hypothetical protein
MQSMSPSEYLGRRVRFTGFLKTENAERASFWMRVDGANQAMLAFDNMDQRSISGTTPWAAYNIVLDVPADATNIAFGVLSQGGTTWIDDLNFSVVDKSVATTTTVTPSTPTNLNFED